MGSLCPGKCRGTIGFWECPRLVPVNAPFFSAVPSREPRAPEKCSRVRKMRKPSGSGSRRHCTRGFSLPPSRADPRAFGYHAKTHVNPEASVIGSLLERARAVQFQWKSKGTIRAKSSPSALGFRALHIQPARKRRNPTPLPPPPLPPRISLAAHSPYDRLLGATM